MVEELLIQQMLNIVFCATLLGFAFLAISVIIVYYRLHMHIKAESRYKEELLEKLTIISDKLDSK